MADTGIGIPTEHHQKIFEEFHRVPGNEQQEGTGLGLAIVRQLVIILGGSITLKSEAGRGSTFAVTLPRAVNSNGGKPDSEYLEPKSGSA